MIVKWLVSEEQTVPYQVLVSGRTNITLELLLPDRLGSKYFTGNRVPIYAFLSSARPIAGAMVNAYVTAPDGTETLVPLNDDGEHGDGAANDGFYAGMYTVVNQADIVFPQGEDAQSDPNDEGGYRVLAVATHEKFIRQALGAFSVLEGPDENQNRLPDTFEEQYGVKDPEGDPDMDGLHNYGEYQHGTNPNDPDTDDGGEKDGSEVNHGRDPLDPSDDQIKKPDFLQVRPLNKGVLLRYDVKPSYSFLRLFRAENESGPYFEVKLDPGLPPTGIYSDTQLVNNQTYFYKMEAVIVPMLETGGQEPSASAADEITSAVLSSEGVTPSEDPIPPEAKVIVNDGAPFTNDLNVTLTFVPFEYEGAATESFEDIAWMLISNNPSFVGATWQEFQQGVPWQLDAGPGELAMVYVRFRDKAENESVGSEVGMIYYMHSIYLPLTVNNAN
jgi:hypothetical protein